jgi:hypothetical protein
LDLTVSLPEVNESNERTANFLTSSGSQTKASKDSTISLILTFSPREIVEDLEAALEQFREIAADLGVDDASGKSCDDQRGP